MITSLTGVLTLFGLAGLALYFGPDPDGPAPRPHPEENDVPEGWPFHNERLTTDTEAYSIRKRKERDNG